MFNLFANLFCQTQEGAEVAAHIILSDEAAIILRKVQAEKHPATVCGWPKMYSVFSCWRKYAWTN